MPFNRFGRLRRDQLCLGSSGQYGRRVADGEVVGVYEEFGGLDLPKGIHFSKNIKDGQWTHLILQ
jgi:hypothetical protein